MFHNFGYYIIFDNPFLSDANATFWFPLIFWCFQRQSEENIENKSNTTSSATFYTLCWCIETELSCFRDFEIKWFTVTLNHLQCSFKKVVYTIVQISAESTQTLFIYIFFIELLKHMPGNIMIFWIWFVTQIRNRFLIFLFFFGELLCQNIAMLQKPLEI